MYAAAGLFAAVDKGGRVLVLTRRVGQSIVIGDNVVVTVLDVRGEQVRIGVEAPRTVEVMRSEIYKAIEEANQTAAQSAAGVPFKGPDTSDESGSGEA